MFQILQYVKPDISGAQEEPHGLQVDIILLDGLVRGILHIDFQEAFVCEPEFLEGNDEMVVGSNLWMSDFSWTKRKEPLKYTMISIAETLELDSILKIWDEYFIALQ